MAFAWPNLNDVLSARKTIAPFLPRTPLVRYPNLNRLVGADVRVKHEDHGPLGVFKARGAVNLISRLDAETRARGVITASTGNHAQAIAFASHLFGVKARIVMPEKANPVKIKAVEGWGAEVIPHGAIFDDSRLHAEHLAVETGARYIHAANEPDLIAGVGTYALEIFEDLPDVEVILVPIGGGSGASGCCLVKAAVNPAAEVIGVQAEKAPAAFLSWKERRIATAPMETAAEGLATMVGFELTQEILQAHLNDFVLVSEEEMRAAVRTYLELARALSEESGAASLAAALKLGQRLSGRKVVLVLSGHNISPERLRSILAG